MASKDEYIHSQGLNVNKSHDMEKTNRDKNKMFVDSKAKDADTTMKPSQPHQSHTHEYREYSVTQNNHSVSHSSYMLEAVAQVMNSPSLLIASKKKPFLSSASTSNLNSQKKIDKDDLVDDPVLKEMNYQEQKSMLHSIQDGDDDIEKTQQSHHVNKDPNRFIKDLDARMSTEIIPKNHTKHLDQENQDDDYFNFFKEKPLQYLSKLGHSVASMVAIPSSIPSSNFPKHTKEIEMEPLNQSKIDNHDEESAFHVSSSAVLGDDEAAELLRIQHRHSDVVSLLTERSQKYFLCIGFLFLLYIWFRN